METKSMFARFLRAAFAVGVVLASATAGGAGTTALIDCGGLGGKGDGLGFPPSPDSNGNYWNTIGQYAAPTSTNNLRSMDNTLTGWGVAVSGGDGESDGVLTNIVVPPTPFNIKEASEDDLISGLDHGGPSHPLVFAFTGLNSNRQYKFTLWGDRDSAAYGSTPHDPTDWANGTVLVTKGTEVERSNPVMLQNTLFTVTITPGTGADAGKITFSADWTAGGGNWFQLCVMSIEEPGDATPSGTVFIVR